MALAHPESFLLPVVYFVFFFVWFRAARFTWAALTNGSAAAKHFGPRPDFANVTWPATFLLLVVAGYVSLVVVVDTVAALAFDLHGVGPGAMTVQAIVNVATCAFAVRFARRAYATPKSAFGFGRDLDGFTTLYSLCGYTTFVPFMLLAAFGSQWIYQQFGREAPVQDVLGILGTVHSVPSFAWLALLTVVVIPITEEILFRGIVFSTIRRRLGPAGAIVVSSAFFALLHNTSVMLPVFVIGVSLAILYDRTQSIVACSAAHMIHNGMQVLLLVLVRR
ncbi:MAG: CPBP family intramembrane metalloprotease [Planctomycetes bacterium]|nr:CPBP family intramembrane metalloprotease [Planctomycetota bacterium]